MSFVKTTEWQLDFGVAPTHVCGLFDGKPTLPFLAPQPASAWKQHLRQKKRSVPTLNMSPIGSSTSRSISRSAVDVEGYHGSVKIITVLCDVTAKLTQLVSNVMQNVSVADVSCVEPE